MDPREQLRQFLERRREAGERDLVLDSLSVEEAMRLIGAGGAAPPAAKPSARSAADAAPPSGDWRDVLRNSGAAPSSQAPAKTDAPAEVPVVREPTAPAVSLDKLPRGITVGAADRSLFTRGALSELETLDAVAAEVAKCTKCPLHATAKNPVPGSGNPNAKFLVVGEAPGQSEDEQGLPFVGAAGQLLTKILAAVDLDRDRDVFICNVLKHRPPGNRNPAPDEVTACSPFLARQFEIIRPRIILALGTFAAQTLLETKLAIGKLRGQLHRYHGVPLIVTYHPAALLRNPSWKRPTWEDVQLARRILDSAVTEP